MGLKLEADAGLEFELATKDDVIDAVKQAVQSLRTTAETIFEGNNGKTDANGNLSLDVYEVPVGKILILERLILWADGFTPIAPSNIGWVGIYNGSGKNTGNLLDFAPQSNGAQVLPSLAEYSHNQAPRFRGGDRIFAEFQGCVASTGVSCFFQGCLEPIARFKKEYGF